MNPSGSHLSNSGTKFCQPAALMAYTVIKEGKQIEHKLVTIIRASARCALPMPIEFDPVEGLHVPIDLHTGAVDSFADWDEQVILRILTTIVQRLGSRKRGEAPSGLHYPYVCDTSRMYCNRADPRVDTANILDTTTCWSRLDLVDLAIDQLFQRLRSTVAPVAREPIRRTLLISAKDPSNPRVAMEIFLNLHSRQKEREKSVGEDYARGNQIFKSLLCNTATKNWPTAYLSSLREA